MAGDPKLDTDASADMDYPEHERTYTLFLSLFKWGTIGVIAILCGMLAYLIVGTGILGGLGAFLIVLAIAYFLA